MNIQTITGTTSLYALLGSPVSHSLSPTIHNTSFAHLGLDAAYVVFDVNTQNIGEAVAGIRALGIRGFNVTMPCKQAVIEHLDALSPAAQLIGAVNTVSVEGDTLTGHNTDGAGMIRALSEAGAVLSDARVVILGAGGAARAIAAQAALDGAAQVHLAKRPGATFATAQADVTRLAEATGVDMALVDFSDEGALADAVSNADILINATPIGMGDGSTEIPVNVDWLTSEHYVADAVYHPRRTALLAAAEGVGATPVEGLNMLVWQGLIAEEIWLGEQLADSGRAISATPVLAALAI